MVEARQPSATILTSSPRPQATLEQATLGHAVTVQFTARTLGLCLGCVVAATVGLWAQDLRRGEKKLNPPICVGSEAGWLHLARVDLLGVVATRQRDLKKNTQRGIRLSVTFGDGIVHELTTYSWMTDIAPELSQEVRRSVY